MARKGLEQTFWSDGKVYRKLKLMINIFPCTNDCNILWNAIKNKKKINKLCDNTNTVKGSL